ncbi:hypothetical protein [Acidiphilium sp.]|uniref:hypothetical protein n=1 Tax=Acidiphilium sp. TaxID=527 RepID=UPI00258879B9|nr:hypothetical protein [Acidiphilium sp.]
MPEMPDIAIAQQIEAADREIRMRQRVYARRVAQGQMNQAEADHEIACMTAIARTLREVRKDRAGQLQLDLAEKSRIRQLEAVMTESAGVILATALGAQDSVLRNVARRLREAAAPEARDA